MKHVLTIFISIFFAINFQAQDAHFSQMDLSMALRNPATIGQMNFDHKLQASYRTQWSEIPQAYRNISIAYEQKLSAISWGGSMLHNDAGKASLQTTQLMLNLSYQKKLSSRGTIIAAGLSGGAIQQRIKPEALQFDNQYLESTGFDANLSSKENFNELTQLMPSFTLGVYLAEKIKKLQITTGFSIAHLNNPSSNFYANDFENYPMRYAWFLKGGIPISKKWKGELQLNWAKQGVAKEQIIGLQLERQLSKETAVNFCFSKRLEDALIFALGFRFKNSDFTLSYDLNNSALTPASNSNGAIALSASYYFNSKNENKQVLKIDGMEEAITSGGENLDKDGDGIMDKIDECPEIPGLAKYNGCNDLDQDGIWDKDDNCPNLFGEKENDGCPIRNVDTDKDGLIDEEDQCPYLKGSVAMNGCPDSDQDGISDLEDFCPFLKGDKTTNGCPKMTIQEHQEFVKENRISLTIEFDTDKHFIKEKYWQELNELILYLKEHPTAKVFVAGHTDNEGDRRYNFQLSERRSHRAMEYLLDGGVPFTQISTVSYGETKPKFRNASAYDKARNRRVELVVYLQ